MPADNNQLLVFDIGNSNVTVAVFEGEAIKSRARFVTNRLASADELVKQISNLFDKNIYIEKFSRVLISSVVPCLSESFRKAVFSVFKTEPLFIGANNCGPLKFNIPSPQTLGADRIANAVAVTSMYSSPAVVIDFGTATTFDIVNETGAFDGGIIAAGFMTSASALLEKAAQLEKNLDLKWPATLTGKTTEAALQSGLVAGYLMMIDGLIERLTQERGSLGKIIATGGLGKLFAEHSKFICEYDPDLTLLGIKLIGDYSYQHSER